MNAAAKINTVQMPDCALMPARGLFIAGSGGVVGAT
jgi:hypothetical protein